MGGGDGTVIFLTGVSSGVSRTGTQHH